MNTQTLKWMIATSLWTAAVALMCGGTARHSVVMMGWGGFAALMACIASDLIIAECAAQKACHEERLRVETIGELIAAKAVERMDREEVTRLR